MPLSAARKKGLSQKCFGGSWRDKQHAKHYRTEISHHKRIAHLKAPKLLES
jgi:hypothetical protein